MLPFPALHYTVGMSYWDFDVKSLKFSAFNDPINDFYSEKTITPEDYLNATHPDDVVMTGGVSTGRWWTLLAV